MYCFDSHFLAHWIRCCPSPMNKMSRYSSPNFWPIRQHCFWQFWNVLDAVGGRNCSRRASRMHPHYVDFNCVCCYLYSKYPCVLQRSNIYNIYLPTKYEWIPNFLLTCILNHWIWSHSAIQCRETLARRLTSEIWRLQLRLSKELGDPRRDKISRWRTKRGKEPSK